MFQQRENGKRPLPPAEVKVLILTLLSAAALTAALVCLICDYFTSEGLSWSWIVTASLAAASPSSPLPEPGRSTAYFAGAGTACGGRLALLFWS